MKRLLVLIVIFALCCLQQRGGKVVEPVIYTQRPTDKKKAHRQTGKTKFFKVYRFTYLYQRIFPSTFRILFEVARGGCQCPTGLHVFCELAEGIRPCPLEYSVRGAFGIIDRLARCYESFGPYGTVARASFALLAISWIRSFPTNSVRNFYGQNLN